MRPFRSDHLLAMTNKYFDFSSQQQKLYHILESNITPMNEWFSVKRI